jgi:hypothetical protein
LQILPLRILRELHGRKLGPGETVYIAELSNKLEISQDDMLAHLRALNLAVQHHGKWLAVTVPDLDTLNSKLSEFGVDVELLEPIKARIHGHLHGIKSVNNFSECTDGRFRFDVDWSGSFAPSTVCCHDLNASARAHVWFGHELLLFYRMQNL